MPKFRKRMLEVGKTYHSPDGPVPVTTERLRHWSDTFSRFKALGLKVPSYFGHQDDPKKVVPRKRLAKDVVGRVTDFSVTADGRYAEVELDVPRKEDAAKVSANLLDLSPVILKSWKDGDGTVHEDCITDIDLVTHPVDHRQGDFAVACSLRMGLDPEHLVMYRLQADEDFPPEEAAEEPESEDMAEEATEENGDGERLQRILEGLARLGLVLSPDTTAENLMEHLEQAILTAQAIGDGVEEPGQEETLEPATPEMNVMSTNPEIQRLSLQLKQERDARERADRRADQQHRDELVKRLSLLLESGRCTPHEHESQAGRVSAVRLSLDETGQHTPSSVEEWVQSREAVPAGTFWSDEHKTLMSTLQPVPQPAEVGTPPTRTEAKEIAQKILKRT